MPYYRRFRRGRGYRRFYRRRGYRRSYRRFHRRRPGVVSSRSRLRVKIPVYQTITITVPQNQVYSYMATIFPWINTLNNNANASAPVTHLTNQQSLGVVQNPIYQSYADLFDEVKCDGFTLTASCTSPIGAGQNVTGLLIGTSVDRSLTPIDIVPTANVARTSASWWGRVAVNNSIPRIRRAIWASDMSERTNFTDSDYTFVTGVGNTALNQIATNFPPNFWRPAMHLGVCLPLINPEADTTITFLLNVNFYMTFRNPKGASGTAANKLALQLKEQQLSPEARAAIIDDDELTSAQQEAIPPAAME